MTMVLKKATPAHPTRSIEDDTVVAMDPTTHQLLAYENAPKSKKVRHDESAACACVCVCLERAGQHTHRQHTCTHNISPAHRSPLTSRQFKLSSDLLGKSNVQLRYDLLDCHIDVCSPEVLASFVDNPDYMGAPKSGTAFVLCVSVCCAGMSVCVCMYFAVCYNTCTLWVLCRVLCVPVRFCVLTSP